MISLLLAASLLSAPAFANEADDQVRDLLIRESIRAYGGPCACPFHFKGDGQTCGVKNRYDLSNGKFPLCYRTDITVEMVEAYRKRLSREKTEKQP